MVKPYAQLAALVFLIVGIAGFFTGDASHVRHGVAGGDFDGVALHLTYAHDVLNLLLATILGYAGWFADEPRARFAVAGVAAFVLLLAVVGFIVNDDSAGTHSIVTLHFPLAINVFHLVAGGLGGLCVLGDLAEAQPAPD